MTIFQQELADEYNPYGVIDPSKLYAEVAQRIIMPNNPPILVLGISLARNGTTASLNYMASADVLDYEGKSHKIACGYQPFKAGLRHAMHNWPDPCWEFKIPDATETPIYYTKDPLGPYTAAEANYNPLDLLTRIGYPKDKMHLLFFYRDPVDTLASWIGNWGAVRDRSTLTDNLILASRNLQAIYRQAQREGYSKSSFLYESLRDNSPPTVIQELFRTINEGLRSSNLQITMNDNTVENWEPERIRGIWHPDEPAIYTRPEIGGLHKAAKGTSGLRYKDYPNEKLLQILEPHEIRLVIDSGTYDTYRFFKDEYEISSGLRVMGRDTVEFWNLVEGCRNGNKERF